MELNGPRDNCLLNRLKFEGSKFQFTKNLGKATESIIEGSSNRRSGTASRDGLKSSLILVRFKVDILDKQIIFFLLIKSFQMIDAT